MEKKYMLQMNYKKIMLIFCFLVFTFLISSSVFATGTEGGGAGSPQTVPSREESLEKMEAEVAAWLDACHENKIYWYEYKDDGEEQKSYAVGMPKPDTNKYPNIIFDAVDGRYVYCIKDSNGDYVDYIPFDVEVLMSVNEPLPSINVNNYDNYTGLTGSTILEDTSGSLLKVASIDSEEEIQIAFAIKLENGYFFATNTAEAKFENGSSTWEQILDAIGNSFAWLWDQVMNPISKIFNDLLLIIADGIHDLIEDIFGTEVSIYKIIFGKIDKLSINYWEISNDKAAQLENGEAEEAQGIVGDSPATTLKTVVEYWYGILRGIVIAVYLLMLLYIGIRILLSSTGKAGQKYKEMLTSWVVGIVILTFYPYIMRYTVVINDMFIAMMDPATTSQADFTNLSYDTDEVTDTMQVIRDESEETGNIALTIIYIIMLGQLIVLIAVYYKRVFMMAFLITIFPIVAGMYIWEKTKGGSSALTTWTREYVILVLTQTFHAVVYVVFVDGAYLAFKQSNNWFIFMISVLFLFESEKIIRTIFGMKSSANTIGDLATAGAAALALSGKAKDIFKSDKKSQTEDDKNEAEAHETASEARKNVAVNNALAASQGNNSNSNAVVGGNINNTGAGQANNSGTPGGNVATNIDDSTDNQMDNLEAAQAVATEDVYKGRKKRGIIAKAINVTGRVAGVTLGATSGLASGSMKDAFVNAAIGNEIGGMAAKAPMSIAGWTRGMFAGKVMKRKINKGDMDEAMRNAGFDLSGKFDPDDAISVAKANLIRQALAAQADVTRRRGKAAGERAFIEVIEKGRKKEGF